MKIKNIKLKSVILEIEGKEVRYDNFGIFGWESNQNSLLQCRGVDLTVRVGKKDITIPLESSYGEN